MMKKIIVYVCACLLLVSCGNFTSENTRSRQLLDSGWKFYRGEANAEQPGFDDSSWRTVDLPHDFSIEDIPGTGSPFSPDAVSGINGGFTEGGIGWYRKNIFVPSSQKDKNFELYFEGAYMNTDVWINGRHLGNHPYGYTPFVYDITDYLAYDQDNVIAVQVKNEGNNSRWYAGSGLYRHVWLTVTNPLHIITHGTYITTPTVTREMAEVVVETSIVNNYPSGNDVVIETVITDDAGNRVASIKADKKINAGNTDVFTQKTEIESPQLWSPDTPYLYNVTTRIYANNHLEDEYKSTFGIRSVSVDAQKGLLLNGVPLKLKGGCVHHDNGPLGAKAYDRAEERKVELMKANGYNAVRASHNPPSTAFLNACDRLGLLVIDEAFDMWEHGKNPQDYHLYYKTNWRKDVEVMLKRDRNHPSVIMWSIGNEIPAMQMEEVVNNARMMTSYIHELEPTRPVTAGLNNLGEELNAFMEVLDVCGYNYAVGGYAVGKYAMDIRNHPKRVIYGSESYAFDACDAWADVEANTAVIGDFIWTAIDYIGEASIGGHGYPQSNSVYPWTLAYCGDIDICGWKRPQSYYRDAFWSDEPVVSLFVHSPVSSFEPLKRERINWSRWHYKDLVAKWNWPGFENKSLKVESYSSCDSVELFLNNQSLGMKETGRKCKYMATWQVPYAPGELKAVGYKAGKKVFSALETNAVASHLKLSADRNAIFADNQDLSYVTVELRDDYDRLDIDAENLIDFEVKGPAVIAGVGNANPVSLESYTQPRRKAWRGKCLVILKSTADAGEITLTATTPGMEAAKITIESK